MQNQHRLRRTIWNFVRPNSEGTVLYVLISIGVVISAWINRLRVTGSGFEVLTLIEDSLRYTLDSISAITSENRTLVFLLWFAVGSMVYIIIWLLANVAIDLYNDIVISSAFVHPKSFKQSTFWGAIASRAVLRIAATIILVLYGAFWIQALMPIWQQSISAFFNSPADMTAIINAAMAIVFCLFSLHVMAVLYRFVTFKVIASYQDL